MTDTAQCGRCGAPVEVGALFCARCGVDVTQSQGDDQTLPLTTGGTPVAQGPGRSTMRQMLRESTLGEYEILDELGRGGMATVFRAHDISLDRKVAIKVLAPNLLEGEGMAERFKLEARTAAQLSHPHIIPIYAVKESASTLFFVMKFVEGRALDEIIGRTGQLPIPMVKDILSKVGSALGYAHRRGVVHRDVKPGNIMIDEEGTPIVTDFGIAKVAEGSTSLTITGTTIGTPSYMSPEQCEAKEVTGQSDQYSLGVVAFQMLTGRLPFEGDTPVNVMYKHCHEPLPPLEDFRPDCPPEILETVTRMVAKAPGDRWPSMEAAIQKLGTATTADTYVDPVRKELVKAAREGDMERLAELSTPGRTITPIRGAEPVEGEAPSADRGRRWIAVAATVVLVVGGATVAVLQPWAAEGGAPPGSGDSPQVGAVGPGGAVPGQGEGAGSEGGGDEVSRGEPDQGTPDLAAGADSALGGAGGEGPGEPVTQGPDEAAGGGGVPAGGGAQPAAPVVDRVLISGVPEGGLEAGASVPLQASARDRSGNGIPASRVGGFRWDSRTPELATVSAQGMVSALAPGTAEITVSVDDVVGRALIEVTEASVASVSVSPERLEMTVGDTESVSAEALGALAQRLVERTVTWSSDDPDIARVDDSGAVEAIGPGQTSLRATAGGASGTVNVTVEPNAERAIEELVAAYASALEAGDISAMRDIYPEISGEEEDRMEDLTVFEDFRANLVVESFEEDGDSAGADVSGTYQFIDPAAGATRLDVRFIATFERRPEGWRITGWSGIANDDEILLGAGLVLP